MWRLQHAHNFLDLGREKNGMLDVKYYDLLILLLFYYFFLRALCPCNTYICSEQRSQMKAAFLSFLSVLEPSSWSHCCVCQVEAQLYVV